MQDNMFVMEHVSKTYKLKRGEEMVMKFKDDVEATATSDFWYDLFEGGYLIPEKFLADPEEANLLEEARQLLMEYKRELMDSGLVEDM